MQCNAVDHIMSHVTSALGWALLTSVKLIAAGFLTTHIRLGLRHSLESGSPDVDFFGFWQIFIFLLSAPGEIPWPGSTASLYVHIDFSAGRGTPETNRTYLFTIGAQYLLILLVVRMNRRIRTELESKQFGLHGHFQM